MDIVYDTVSNKSWTNGVTSITWSHTVAAGDNLLLTIGGMTNSGTYVVTGATYNGVNCTLVDSETDSAGNKIYFFYLLNPATGSNNCVVSLSASRDLNGAGLSYSGVKQSAQPDSKAKAGTGASPYVLQTTSVANGCVAIGYFRSNGGTYTTDPAMTRKNTDAVVDMRAYDTNSALSASATATITITSPSNPMGVIATFAPATSGTAVTPSGSLGLLGIGS